MTVQTEARPAPVRVARKPVWWRRPWVAPLAAIVGLFLAYSLPPYLTLDPARARVPAPPGFAAHYWFLLAHITFGTVAIVGVVLQIWPWLRRAHPVAHRRIGRIYVFGGALPSAVMAAVIGAVSPFGPILGTLDVVGALLWFGFTVAGWRAVRQRRFADHRKWMVRSFAMTMNTLTTRALSPLCYLILMTRTPGKGVALILDAATLSGALSLLTLLGLSQWWLERKPKPAIAR
ncbi:DUF2306 domain-containing protein [Amycolatopsis australiensis]|uniref:Predicted membrane protein n=1 Tax=Amycolatopsis australiensis TaxID=546364 RepID=A0A1K1QSN8_9PSEU|nr:DUF2306 domain-containing protein [Amycolatopsis australiensis]SFW62970.1 Predicted membrane protein [Amycolatopsis australiensis]